MAKDERAFLLAQIGQIPGEDAHWSGFDQVYTLSSHDGLTLGRVFTA